MDGGRVLPVLLSHALVAYTIEVDNEAERRVPHTTTRGTATGGPWLTSAVMWWNCLRFVGEDGVRVGELARLARTPTNLHGMQRWGYVVVAPDPADARATPPKSDFIVRATPRGRNAAALWESAFGEIERRWERRFGAARLDELGAALRALVGAFHVALPDCMPILGPGLFTRVQTRTEPLADGQRAAEVARLPLPALLARTLTAFALRFEAHSPISLALGANVLHRLARDAVRVRDLPQRSGISKEAIAMALGWLERGGYVAIENVAKGRAKTVALTATGAEAQRASRERLRFIESQWHETFGGERVERVRRALEELPGEELLRGLDPAPENWRAARPPSARLPDFPMVLHRGGYPDGS